MNLEDLRKRLLESEDKYAILSDLNTLIPYNISIKNLEDLINEFLTDEEKGKIIKSDLVKGLKSYTKVEIIQSIKENSIKQRLLEDKEVLEGLHDYEIISIAETLDNDRQIQFLRKLEEGYEGPQISETYLYAMIESLSKDSKKILLYDKNLLKDKLKIKDIEIINLICELEGMDQDKLRLGELYGFDSSLMYNIIYSFSDDNKKKFILENPYGYNGYNLQRLINTLGVDSLIDLLKNSQEFLRDKKIKPYELVRELTAEDQLKLISLLEDMNLSLGKKREIIASLHEEAKQKIDKTSLPEEYRLALETKIEEDPAKFLAYGKIIIDFDKDLEIYRGLDELITINALTIKQEDREKFLKLCEICPNLKITDDLDVGISTVEEYKNSERWIQKILQGIDPEWSDIEKIAFIDNAIGKKISYTPDFGTEVFERKNARALWKIIDSGYGVCNGIAQAEQYMLGKLGIEAERVSSHKHCFLRLKNVKLPMQDGNIVVGDTLLDPTWNLTENRFGAMPQNFCISYESIRKHDIRQGKIDTKSHENEDLADVTLELDEKSLRNAFKKVGLTDIDGNFPIKALKDKSKEIDDSKPSGKEQISKQLQLLKEYYPDFAMCENSYMRILEFLFDELKNSDFDKCIINRVYDKSDEEKKPVIYVYANFEKLGKYFWYVDKNQGDFIELGEKEFGEKFECYEEDLKEYKGHRPWEDADYERKEDLNKRKIVADEGEER